MASHKHGRGDVLEEILAAIAPEKVAEKVIIPHRRIRESYKLGAHQVASYEDFTEEVRKYVAHHWKEWYKGEISDEDALGQAHEILNGVFQKEGGFKHAFTLAKQGKLDEVISALSGHFEAQAQDRYVTHHIRTRIDPNDLEAQAEVIKNLFNKYEAFLPNKPKLKDPRFYVHHHPQLIQAYAGLVERFMNEYAQPEQPPHKSRGGHGGGHGANH